MHVNIQKEKDTETEKSIYYDFMRFGDSSIVSLFTVVNSLHSKLYFIALLS
jgi:hypothetical protein